MRFLIPVLVITLFIPIQSFAFCFNEAGNMYDISPQLLWSIAKTESNLNPKAINRNTNGSYDYGVMQINSTWAKKLGTTWNALSDPCTNVKVGAWILSQCVRDYGNTWQAVGCYNSRTPSKRDRYAVKVYQALQKIPKQEFVKPNQASQPLVQVSDNGILSVTPWEEVFGVPNTDK
jgi:soluble lytic murein transglycosylase-like protein